VPISSQAKENLAKVKDAVGLSVETAFNKQDRTREMLKASQEVIMQWEAVMLKFATGNSWWHL
jgi:hypothetical protein